MLQQYCSMSLFSKQKLSQNPDTVYNTLLSTPSNSIPATVKVPLSAELLLTAFQSVPSVH